ncbi:shikimate kinase [Sporosarcina sp. BI001-red]|uniref:shikimate kinase n=1 Tax=Sporosarcina sp. BI001-red TaxID=2282866 RepID=UPI000E25178D|nr:shikimate kinase [Sporosarcina sp. BI001-red]REB10187.1 shikimate kinase [Sporosarcina sp. BI001-red]
MNKVYLVGFMGCGKSAIGKRLSFFTKLPFYDMDHEIVQKTGMTIPQIFATYGEERFREMETEFLKTFRDEMCIIATGGGVAMRKENRKLMRESGLVFFLDAPFRDIWRRIATDKNRPIVQRSTRSEIEKLYQKRYDAYKESAHFLVQTRQRSLSKVTEYIAFQMERLSSKSIFITAAQDTSRSTQK